ncbi:MAG TPA: GDSL-type esterase/lipase family protein [Opitutaceae bacterium]|nr:GDSL-type esterase/lipase family protein [Opitutaceae bacterium]
MKALACGGWWLLTAAAFAADPAALRFDFGPGPVAPGYTQVLPSTTYSDQLGYGFDFGSTVIGVDRGGSDPLRGDFITSDHPFFFSVKVPEGNYRVTVTLGDAAGESVATVKAESRRLVLEQVRTAPGGFATHVFAVNVRTNRLPPPPPNAPGGDQVLLDKWEKANGPDGLVLDWDDRLTLEFNPGAAPGRSCVCAVELAQADDLPTVFLAGDSTLTDQPREPGASWGQMLPRFLKPTVAVANHAESGETLKSFISELRLVKILSQMKRGDYLFIQFGHNDEKQNWPQTYVDAHTTYKAYLKVFIAEARLRGATPVLVTPMQRRQFDAEGRIRNSHGDYPAAMRAVAQEEQVVLIDLEAMSRAFYEALGPEKAPLAFSGGGRDATHHDNYGAYELAKCVVQGIRDNRLPLAADIVDDFTGFDPAHPDAPETLVVAPSPLSTTEHPRGN